MTETKLISASVYRGGCIVKRAGTLTLQAGMQQVKLCGLSASADDSSLRLSVPEGVNGSNVQVEYPTREQQQDALKELAQKAAELQSRISAKEKMAALWETNADFSQKASLSVEEMSAYLEKLPERLEAISRDLTRLREEKKAIEKEYAEAKNKAALPYVTAELYAAKAGEYPVELTYRDYQASWNPVYEIHSENDSESLKLRMRAQIRQNTHEDWEGAALTLFSGNPSVSGTIPEMNPTYLRFYMPRPKARNAGFGGMMKASAMRETKMAMEEECMDADAAMEMSAAPMMNMVAADSGRAVKGETMTEYPLNGTWDIRKGQEIICDIKTDLLGCRYHVVAVPKLSDEAYLAAEVATADLEDMQNTPAAVYVNGAFAGNVVLEPDMTKDSYDLSLGVDETVKIKRRQTKRHTQNVLLKGQKKTEYAYEITLASRKEKAVDVTVTDQIPVSNEKTIVVEPIDLSGAEKEDATGLLHWNFRLGAGESKTITLAYSVAWPKDKLTEEVE